MRILFLRDVLDEDLPILFEQQQDVAANHMAAFTVNDPNDRMAFDDRWLKILTNDTIVAKTIVFDEQVAGHIGSFELSGEREVTYWIGREFWNKGIATGALKQFLDELKIRPLYARAAKDNIGSIRVLEKCGFAIVGEDKGFSNARGEEIEEYVLMTSS
jgi:RimJ/RimL family protein N-acetyltransferase